MLAGGGAGSIRNTSYKVVLPFYVYAAISFLISSIFLFTTTSEFTGHYFNPSILAIVHTMALGWGTMIILGAAYQLIPVLIEARLYSEKLAFVTFALNAVGIPLLVYGMYVFNMGWPSKCGGILIVASVFTFLLNTGLSMAKSKNENIHAVFILTATTWLFFTTVLGLLQVYNFSSIILPADSIHYLALHAHAGIIGWFLLLIIGVASRLIPMFLISKYNNVRLLWWIYSLINAALVGFIILFFYSGSNALFIVPVMAVLISIGLFIYYCYCSYKQRIRRQVDEQMKLSLVSVLMMLIPILFLLSVILILLTATGENMNLILSYGFLIFFGWITAIILGMTFKTLPFIVWNKVYHKLSGLGKTPNPKELFSDIIFKAMSFVYIAGLVLFTVGILCKELMVLKAGASLMLLTAILYNWNVLKLTMHKPKML